MRSRHRAALALLLVASVSCASVGTGDPLVVRTEDVLSNSLTIYDHAMQFHFLNSTRESVSEYQAFEAVRMKFPTAWKALYDSLQTYKASRTTAGANAVQNYLQALQTLVDGVRPFIGE